MFNQTPENIDPKQAQREPCGMGIGVFPEPEKETAPTTEEPTNENDS